MIIFVYINNGITATDRVPNGISMTTAYCKGSPKETVTDLRNLEQPSIGSAINQALVLRIFVQ